MLDLFFHPFSSFSQKVLIALYENATSFNPRPLTSPENGAELQKLWPLGRFPVLRAGPRTIMETSAIIEYLDVHHRGAVRLIPEDPDAAIEARMRDRIFDNYVMSSVQAVVSNALRPADKRDPHGVAAARSMLDKTYGWLDAEMRDREWACGSAFSLADCAAAPSLFYADWTHPIGAHFPALAAYRARLNARPSFARCIEDARAHRHLFPLGAPDRD